MFIKFLGLILFSIIISLQIFSVYAENEPLTTDQTITILEWMVAPIVGLGGGLVGYFVRLMLDRRNITFEKEVDHEKWLLQKFHPLAEKYYFPLARFSFETYTTVKHASKIKNEHAMKRAYYNFGMFVSKYIDFKNETGGNFLFRNRDREKEAIQKIRALLRIMPFSDIQINEIANEIKKEGSEFYKGCYEQNNYKIFSEWILSANCKNSVTESLEKFQLLADNLDNGGEEISHPKLNRKNEKMIRTISIGSKTDFYILSLNSKEASKNEKILIYGNGFEYDYNSFEFFIGTTSIPKNVINDEYVEVTIPNSIQPGFYDIHAKNEETKFSSFKEKTESVYLALRIK